MGATGPATVIGSAVQHAAECLSGITIHQLAKAGSPIVWGGSPASFDMRTGTTPMGAMATMMLDCTYAQIGKSIKPGELVRHAIRRGERVLFKTHNSGRCWDTDSFVEDFVYLSAKAAQYLAERQVRLVGVDYLSVGGFRADGVETHQALLKAGIWVIEGLNLKRVRPGRVQLVCLPLKVAGGDGAPARALVRPIDRYL